jgi:hypothetical protein
MPIQGLSAFVICSSHGQDTLVIRVQEKTTTCKDWSSNPFQRYATCLQIVSTPQYPSSVLATLRTEERLQPTNRETWCRSKTMATFATPSLARQLTRTICQLMQLAFVFQSSTHTSLHILCPFGICHHHVDVAHPHFLFPYILRS